MVRRVCKEIYVGKPWSYVQHATKFVNRIFGGVEYFRGCGPGYVTFGLKKFFIDYTFEFKYGVSYDEKQTMITFMSDKGTLIITFENAGQGMVRTCAMWSGIHEFWFKGALKRFLDQFSDALVQLCKDPTYCYDPASKEPKEFDEYVTMNAIVFIIRGVPWANARIIGEEKDGKRQFKASIRGGILENFKICEGPTSCTEIDTGVPIDDLDYTLFEDIPIEGYYHIRVEPTD